MTDTTPHGRGTGMRPPNRFGETHAERDLDQVVADEDYLASLDQVLTEYIPDHSRTIISENESPDIPFRYSINPYRGCQHGCAYCYARPYHEFLGLNAGIDFESKIFVKHDAPKLFRDWLNRRDYVPQPIMFSGVTDCYQPCERECRLTRGLLEVALEARQPIAIVTKNALVTRDLDLLTELSSRNLAMVGISITSLDPQLSRTMEPRTSSPEARLRTIRELSAAGIPTRVMVAPVVPGLTDSEMPQILRSAADAGATTASYILLRLPLAVSPIFLDWLRRTQPTKAARVEGHIRSTRDGNLSDAKFGRRMRGTGAVAKQIQQAFEVFARKAGLQRRGPSLDTTQFRPPAESSGQLRLF